MASILVTKEQLAEDAVFVLQCLRQNVRDGRSNHLVDVRNTLANSVTLDFNDYVKFLRKFEYASLDREAHVLGLTAAGEQASLGESVDALQRQVGDFFSEVIAAGVVEVEDVEGEDSDEAPPDLPPPLPKASGSGAASMSVTILYARGEQLGEGPLGRVFKARHGATGAEVALKEYKDLSQLFRFVTAADLAQRLRDATNAQAAVRHPFVARVYDLETAPPAPYVVTELAASTVRARLAGGKPLAPEQALRLTAQIAYALAAAHARGLFHHDLKPENVLLDDYGNAKVADFGVGRLVSTAPGQPRVQLDAGLYLAPEQQRGQAAGAAADVYALGLVFYELISGALPGRRSPEPSKAAPGIPAALDALFDKMTSERPEDRYGSMDALLDELHKAAPQLGARGTAVIAASEAPSASAPASAEPAANGGKAAKKK